MRCGGLLDHKRDCGDGGATVLQQEGEETQVTGTAVSIHLKIIKSAYTNITSENSL